MDIKRAKKEIKDSIEAYLAKDEYGDYMIPSIRQRPILLMGPPGIGKTQVMEQVAKECKVALVSYTITHHTRQSAVGLPFIEKKTYDGKEYSVTEYTMSEIIASVYDKMEETGLREGILFIDEINCVSETLAPTMLQFLQCKTFGNQKIPTGWIIVAAGNPPEYNKSVRDFDVVTLDRIKKIDVDVNYDVWKEYASAKGLHPSVLSYLSLKREHFYHIENTADRICFVTARGWEDLSAILYGYEDMHFAPDENLIRQYLQDEEIARDFGAYYQLYAKYRQDYRIPEILSGSLDESVVESLCTLAAHAPTDERLTVAGLLLDGWNSLFLKFREEDQFAVALQSVLRQARASLLEGNTLAAFTEQYRTSQKIRLENHLLDRMETDCTERIARILEQSLSRTQQERISALEEVIAILRHALEENVKIRQDTVNRTSLALHLGFSFAESAFGDGPEILFLISDLSHNANAVSFISHFGCEEYFRFNKKLKFQEERQNLLQEIDSVIRTV